MNSFRATGTLKRQLAVFGLGLAIHASTSATELVTLRDVAREAVLNNPEVLQSFHQFKAAEFDVRERKGDYLPDVYAEGAYGKEWRDTPLRPEEYDFTRDRVSLGLRQMIFDGFLTRNEVRRLSHDTRTKYFETYTSAEITAMEAMVAYVDVIRHRTLVELSEENYAAHRLIYDQIERRTKAGVGRRVDLEQITGRLALSESNLLTDTTNLYDVSRRFQRITGHEPAAMLAPVSLSDTELNTSLKDLLERAYRQNPRLLAAVADIWAWEAATDAAKSQYLPRLDLFARTDVWHDKDDINGKYEESVVELVMTYNFYNGGSDRAAVNARAMRRNAAMDDRDRICRNIRQEIAIAYNEYKRMEEQLDYLDTHQLSIEKAREAYRGQFDLGQRTLLDLLDTENEYYEARRAYANGEADRTIALGKTHAYMGNLLSALEVRDDFYTMEFPEEYEERGSDFALICPYEIDSMPAVDKEAIFQRAMQNQGLMVPRSDADSGAVMPYMKGGIDDRGSSLSPGMKDIYSVKHMRSWLKPDVSSGLEKAIADLPPDYAFIEIGTVTDAAEAGALTGDLPGLATYTIPAEDGTLTVFTGPYETAEAAARATEAFPRSAARGELVVRPLTTLKNPS